MAGVPAGHWMVVSETTTSTDARDPDQPNLRPGPQDEGGHGGMATREQEQRVHDEAQTAQQGEQA